MSAEIYTHGHHDSVLRSHRSRSVENSAAYLRPFLQPGRSLLDVGCGPGSLTADLAKHVAPGRVVAIDRAESVLDEARRNLAAFGELVSVAAGDVYRLGFDDASFDIVHAHQVLQHLREPVNALAELKRVCRPDGVVAARDSEYGSFRWFPEDERLDAWLTMYQRVARSHGAYPDAGRRCLRWAQEAGFREVTASASVWLFATRDARAFWAELWAERITGSALAEQAIAAEFATQRELQAMADGFRAWAAADGGWMSLTHGEILARP
jgi:ubiquinone/menaquinone biosynthesis C-methylase UbiE